MDKIITKLSITDLVILDQINKKKHQTSVDIVKATKIPSTNVYRSLDKLMRLKLLSKRKAREGYLIPNKRIEIKLNYLFFTKK